MRVSRAPRKYARKLPCDSVILIVHSMLSTTAASIHESMHLECLRPFLIFTHMKRQDRHCPFFAQRRLHSSP